MKIVKRVVAISSISAVALMANPLDGNIPNLPNVNSSTINKQLQAPRDIPTKQKEIIDIEGAKNIELLKDDGSNKTILIKSFEISGNTKMSTAKIMQSIKEFENKELTFKQLQEVTQIITKLYRDKNYFVARAYLPAQNIENNNNKLQIKIIEGKYGKIKVDNKSLLSDNTIQEIFDNNSKSKGVINYDDMQKSILLVNDRAGVKVTKAQISQGDELGTSNFDIETVATPRVGGYLILDNYGSRYTGYYRAQLLTNINNLAKVGDKLTLSGLVSNGANLKNGRIAYELPLNSYGLMADIAYTRTDYSLTKEYEKLDAFGNSNVYEMGLSYPILLQTEQALFAKMKFFHKDLNDYIYNEKYENKFLNSIVTSLDYEKNYYIGNYPSRLFSTLDFTVGNVNTKNGKQDGRYSKVEAYASNEIAFNEIFGLNTSLATQKAFSNKNLDGNEQLSLGGTYGVKVYPYSEQSGDNGYIFTNEVIATLPNINSYSHKVGLFYDIADAYRVHPELDAGFERKKLKDIGLGYYSKYKDFFAKVQVAWTANSQAVKSESGAHQNSKILFQTGVVF